MLFWLVLCLLGGFQIGFWTNFALAAKYWPRDENGERL